MREEIVRITEWLLQVHQESQAPGSSRLPRYLAASDIHGNGWRLREVLKVAEQENVDHVYLVGDLYSGPGGWELYRFLRSYLEDEDAGSRVTLMWGNHELAFVSGMLGNNKQLRFFYGYGGADLIRELNAEREQLGKPKIELRSTTKLLPEDMDVLREVPELVEMRSWIQNTHKIFARDVYGTGYVHAFPKINKHGEFVFQYQGKQGIPAFPLIERDLREATQSDWPVFSMLLQTETSPVWAIFEISNARQFDQAARSSGIRQMLFGHRHHTTAVNVGNFNRQIGIAVDFDRGLGGYVIIGPEGLIFHQFVDSESHATKEKQLVAAVGSLSPRETHLHEIEESLFRRLVELEQQQFQNFPLHSTQARHEFEFLEGLRARGFPWIHRLYAELYSHVKDPDLRTDMFASTVASGDEEAFRSFIHLLFKQIRELESYGNNWYSEPYLLSKSITTVLMSALREMPVARLGLLDVKLRGTTTRLNLTELYKRMLGLEDPDLALLAVQNLGMLHTVEADQALRRAFIHDVRKVRVQAAEVLASHGEVAYPLIASLLRNSDVWVRCLTMWTLAELSRRSRKLMAADEPSPSALELQVIHDLRRVLQRENDWFLYMVGKELLRKLNDPDVDSLAERPEIPNLTDAVIEILQEIVDSELEPFRRAFKVYFITVELSSLVYRRGLIGLDIDDLKIYVNDEDYFPPYYRSYKSGDWDMNGVWRGWRKLWIRGETPNLPDGPQIFELEAPDEEPIPSGGLTIVLYDYRTSNRRVTLPPLDEVIAKHGLGKSKDRARHALLERWHHDFSELEQSLMSRLHAAALLRMLFDLPAEVFLAESEWQVMQSLAEKMVEIDHQKARHVLKLTPPESDSARSHGLKPHAVAHPQWLDVPKFSVTVFLRP